jgi:hypothetical protein
MHRSLSALLVLLGACSEAQGEHTIVPEPIADTRPARREKPAEPAAAPLEPAAEPARPAVSEPASEPAKPAAEPEKAAVSCARSACELNLALPETAQPRELHVARCSGAECGRNRGVLRDAGVERLGAIAQKLATSSLKPVYGCPRCGDGPTDTVRLTSADGRTQRFDYEPDETDLPAPLKASAALLDELRAAVLSCRSTSLVQVSDPCIPF